MKAAPASSLAKLVRQARLAVAEPRRVIERLRQFAAATKSRPAPAAVAINPLNAFIRYRQHAEALDIRQPLLFLSFDCDTDLDPPASIEVMKLLDKLGIKATFAVPGVQLERGADIYRAIAARGSEFMNHGHLPHAEWRDDRYIGITFYETMPFEVVEADIRNGHNTVTRIIGRPPRGFRAPHFGHFRQAHQLALVHRVASELGYRYCSTTLPEYGLEHGPASVAGSLIELPAFGSIASPTSILDSWTYLSDRKDYALSETYGDLFVETVDALLANGMPALLTWYADPAHVAGQAPFERAIKHIAARGIKSLSGTEAAALGRPH